MRQQLMRLFLALVIAFVTCSVSSAGFYAFTFDQLSYTAAPGENVAVQVYLQETGGTNLQDIGLIGAGVQVRFDILPQPSSPAKVLASTDIADMLNFDVVWSKSAEPDLGYADLSLGTFGTVFGSETVAGSGIYRVPLGEFTFTAGTLTNETTYISATDYDLNLDDTILADFTVLDGLISDGTATITTIPEPSSFVLIVLGMLSLGIFNTRKRGKNNMPVT